KAVGPVLDAATRTEFVRSHKCDAKAIEMTYWSLPTPARAAKSVNVMAVACAHADADALVDTVEAGGLEVVGLDVRTWATARVCAASHAPAGGVLMFLDLGWAGATLAAWHRGVIVYERPMPEAGLKNLESAIIEQLRLSPEAARYFLFEDGLANPE